MSSGLSLAEVWRRVTSDGRGGPSTSTLWVFSGDGKGIVRGESMAEAFAARFESVYDCPRGEVCTFRLHGEGPGDSAVDAPFSVAEVLGVLEACKDGAAGMDRVTYADLRGLSEPALNELVGLFNDVYGGGGRS